MRSLMINYPKSGIMASIGTALGLGYVISEYGETLFEMGSDYVTSRATSALAEMLRKEEEERRLSDAVSSILSSNQNVTKPFLKHMFKQLNLRIRVDKSLKKLKKLKKEGLDVPSLLWKEFQSKGFTQAFTSIYTICLIHVLSATVSSVFGRCHRQQDDASSMNGEQWNVDREHKIKCMTFYVQYFQDKGLDEMITKIQNVVEKEVELVQNEKSVNETVSFESFQGLHARVRRRIEDSIVVDEDDHVSSNLFASYLTSSSSSTSTSSSSDALLGVVRDVLSSPLCAMLMHRIFDEAFKIYLEDIKGRVVFKGKESVLLGTLLSFLCIGNFKGSFGFFSVEKNIYLEAFAQTHAMGDYVSAIYQSSVLPHRSVGDNSSEEEGGGGGVG